MRWNFDPDKQLAAGASANLTFWVQTTQYVSGAYYNEVLVDLDDPKDDTMFEHVVHDEDHMDIDDDVFEEIYT